ncbi:DedA family protein [Inquilinus sp. CA228]|uniref:DedA family protein n=1 Tax=Inquilinus sp. CA228 TaxID=3455609 RepID=UPI003F8D240F
MIPAADGLVDRVLGGVGLPQVFLAALAEKAIPVLPSYLLFPAIGMGAATVPDLLLRCAAATLGSVGGGLGWYLSGALIGPVRVRRLVKRHGRWVLLRPQLYDRMAEAYRRRPFAITVLGQLVPTVRIFQALPAGVLRLPLLPFLAATGIGALCWIVPLAVAGHVLHRYGWTASEAGVALLLTLLVLEGSALLIARHRVAAKS